MKGLAIAKTMLKSLSDMNYTADDIRKLVTSFNGDDQYLDLKGIQILGIFQKRVSVLNC